MKAWKKGVEVLVNERSHDRIAEKKTWIALVSMILSISIYFSSLELSFWKFFRRAIISVFPESSYIIFTLIPVGVLGTLFYLLICKILLKEKLSKNFIASLIVGVLSVFLSGIGLILYLVLTFEIR